MQSDILGGMLRSQQSLLVHEVAAHVINAALLFKFSPEPQANVLHMPSADITKNMHHPPKDIAGTRLLTSLVFYG